ncbi:MAG: HypC/HybG/HupF family hydrogenase formation chaperone [Thaumarchaeota archaeon]|nr:MAG: HypC/HybG/HupF family hydrogenase formation chaperone [Nitrososphaerota archaeon]HDD66155.1 HypC/HybG/HupF family hydrogenase formation chaperone [Nitrososphaeria archaeon]
MCYAIPARVVEKRGDMGVVDFGNGVRREALLGLVDAKVGDYVLVHAGYAIKVIDEESALEILREFEEVLRLAEEG